MRVSIQLMNRTYSALIIDLGTIEFKNSMYETHQIIVNQNPGLKSIQPRLIL